MQYFHCFKKNWLVYLSVFSKLLFKVQYTTESLLFFIINFSFRNDYLPAGTPTRKFNSIECIQMLIYFLP